MSRKGLSALRPVYGPWLAPAAVLVAALVSGCDVGNGNTLRSLKISDTAINSFQCFNSQLALIGTFDDGGQENDTLRAEWKSSNPNIVRVSNGDEVTPAGLTLPKGILSPVALGGPVTISASFVGLSTSVQVNVLPAKLEITPVVHHIAEGTGLQLLATGVLGVPGSQSLLSANNIVLWDVRDVNGNVITDTNLASISTIGLLATGNNGLTAGSTIPLKITATTDIAGCNAPLGNVTADVTIHNESLASLTPAPASLSVAPGTSKVISVTGNFSNGFVQDLTTQIKTQYTNDTTNVGVGLFGLFGTNVLTALTAGSASLPIKFDQGLSAPVTTANVALTVSNATLTSLALSPSSPVYMLPGTTLAFHSTGTFSDSTTQDMTLNTTWTTTPVDTTIATISNTIGSQGVVAAPTTSNGTLTVTATNVRTDSTTTPPTVTTITGTATLTTTGVSLNSLTVTGPNGETSGNLSVPVGSDVQMNAAGNLLVNGIPTGSQDLTRQVVWTSSNESVANVSNSSSLSGQVTGVTPGSAVLTARFGSVTQDFAVTVN